MPVLRKVVSLMDDTLNGLCVVAISLVCGFVLGVSLCDRVMAEVRQINEVLQWNS